MTNWVQIFTGLLFYACWDTPSENTGLWQLPKVSSAFKHKKVSNTRIRFPPPQTNIPRVQSLTDSYTAILCLAANY